MCQKCVNITKITNFWAIFDLFPHISHTYDRQKCAKILLVVNDLMVATLNAHWAIHPGQMIWDPGPQSYNHPKRHWSADRQRYTRGVHKESSAPCLYVCLTWSWQTSDRGGSCRWTRSTKGTFIYILRNDCHVFAFITARGGRGGGGLLLTWWGATPGVGFIICAYEPIWVRCRLTSTLWLRLSMLYLL